MKGELYEYIEFKRIQKGLTIDEFCEGCGISKATYHRIRLHCGGRSPKVLSRLSAYLCVSRAYLSRKL